MLGV
jgi:hypothetical protein